MLERFQYDTSDQRPPTSPETFQNPEVPSTQYILGTWDLGIVIIVRALVKHLIIRYVDPQGSYSRIHPVVLCVPWSLW